MSRFQPTRVDREATKKRGFLHPRSYVHLNGHDYLRGKDRTRVRLAVFVRATGRCEFCGQFLCGQGEMHHIKHLTPLERCDCLHNLAWACRRCHRKEHGREPQLAWLNGFGIGGQPLFHDIDGLLTRAGGLLRLAPPWDAALAFLLSQEAVCPTCKRRYAHGEIGEPREQA